MQAPGRAAVMSAESARVGVRSSVAQRGSLCNTTASHTRLFPPRDAQGIFTTPFRPLPGYEHDDAAAPLPPLPPNPAKSLSLSLPLPFTQGCGGCNSTAAAARPAGVAHGSMVTLGNGPGRRAVAQGEPGGVELACCGQGTAVSEWTAHRGVVFVNYVDRLSIAVAGWESRGVVLCTRVNIANRVPHPRIPRLSPPPAVG